MLPHLRFKLCLRKGFLAEAIPVNLVGIGGPGAPHVFELSLRNSLGAMTDLHQFFELREF